VNNLSKVRIKSLFGILVCGLLELLSHLVSIHESGR